MGVMDICPNCCTNKNLMYTMSHDIVIHVECKCGYVVFTSPMYQSLKEKELKETFFNDL